MADLKSLTPLTSPSSTSKIEYLRLSYVRYTKRLIKNYKSKSRTIEEYKETSSNNREIRLDTLGYRYGTSKYNYYRVSKKPYLLVGKSLAKCRRSN